jgi:SAM-dependent methyltransferase
MTYLSETSKYRHLTEKYCYREDGKPGCGIDIASQGDPVVPWALSFDLSHYEFGIYNCSQPPKGIIHLRGRAEHLPFEPDVFDFVYSSHLLEDFLDWEPPLREWSRCVRPGGYLVILMPDRDLWAAAIAKGQPPNCSHRHEAKPGEMSEVATRIGLTVVEDRLTNCFDGDYSILGVFRK